ncbi:hypothetical protein B5F82_05030 [Megamonas hypermegale]|uniref:hypothetical protein n=1 Tax=Megamonas hypermegale TaxID=158847 RepID=UPI000B3ABED6|nr:hypothetical protein [Megamonas hypermegale]OUO40272.1 hypothetical protein B5F82_05030 [Megamonas hypermegale]
MSNKDLSKEKLEEIVIKLENKYLTKKNIYVYLVSKNDKVLDTLDAVLHIIKTSIYFYQYHRALRYIVIFKFLCEKYFNLLKLDKEKSGIKI